jgi:hypothetical protein
MPDAYHQRAMMSEQAVRELKALLDLYWSLCGSWVVAPDTELRLRNELGECLPALALSKRHISCL